VVVLQTRVGIGPTRRQASHVQPKLSLVVARNRQFSDRIKLLRSQLYETIPLQLVFSFTSIADGRFVRSNPIDSVSSAAKPNG